MKSFIYLLFILYQISSVAQDTAPLTLSTNAGHHGTTWSYSDTGQVEHMRPELLSTISALMLSEGTTVEIHDREDCEGRDMLRLIGPLSIDDLKTLPRLHGSGTWDNAIASFRLFRTSRTDRTVGPNEIAQH